jgi:hypothetical protein
VFIDGQRVFIVFHEGIHHWKYTPIILGQKDEGTGCWSHDKIGKGVLIGIVAEDDCFIIEKEARAEVANRNNRRKSNGN